MSKQNPSAEDNQKQMGLPGVLPGSKKGITVADVLRIFPGARIVPRKSEAEIWLEAQGVPEAERRGILEESARWVLKDGQWQQTGSATTMKGAGKC
jgi:hypothetical protein